MCVSLFQGKASTYQDDFGVDVLMLFRALHYSDISSYTR